MRTDSTKSVIFAIFIMAAILCPLPAAGDSGREGVVNAHMTAATGDYLWDKIPKIKKPCPGDSDCDGLTDDEEDSNHNGELDPGETDPKNSETDADGIPDGEEINIGTEPALCDTDGDGLSDGVELGRIQPADRNNCHGLYAAGTNYRKPHVLDPLNPDSDGDGVCDGPALTETEGCQVAGEDKNGNGWVDPDESDPTVVDSDGDGLSDGVEAQGDFDGDLIPDYDVLLIRAGQDCSPPGDINDVDCDGIPNARDGDSDNDGCIDSLEGGWLDANGNGIPDVFDNQAKACPEEADSSDGGGRPSGSPEGEARAPTFGPSYAGDVGDGGACALMEEKGRQGHLYHILTFMFFPLIIIYIYCYCITRHRRNQKFARNM